MDKHTIKIRGDVLQFLKTGPVALAIVFSIIVLLFGIYKDTYALVGIIKLYIGVVLFVALGVFIQTIKVTKDYIVYSSNFFPIFKRRIPISSISYIGFGKGLTKSHNSISRKSMSIKDKPKIGLSIYNSEGQIIGGFNTKVYNTSDLDIVIRYIIDISPTITTDWF